ncbi:MAG: BatD family protein [Planctomycetota bacterium]
MRTRDVLMVMVFLIGGIVPTGAMAQDDTSVSVVAELARRSAFVGDDIVFQITVDGATRADRPSLRVPDGLRADFLGGRPRSSVFTQIVQGRVIERREEQYLLQYRVSAQRAGTYTIPGVDVVVDGKRLRTRPVTLEVREPSEAPGFSMRASVDRERVWVGEVVRVRVEWDVASEVSDVSFEATALPAAFGLLDSPQPATGGPTDRFEFTLRGRSVTAAVEPTASGVRVVFELRLVAQEAGIVELGPIAATFTTGGTRAGRERLIARSAPVSVEVRELPAAPPGFSGLIGTYTLDASLERQTANVGDPLRLAVRIGGAEPMLGLGREPPVVLPEDFGAAFTLAPDGWQRRDGPAGSRVYETTVRANSVGVEALPGIELIVFDPRREGYVTLRTEEIPLRIRSAREITAADAIGGGGSPGGSAAGAAPGSASGGELGGAVAAAPTRVPRVWAEDRGEGLLVDDAPLWWYSPAAAGALIAAPPLLFGCAAGGVAFVRHRRTPRARALAGVAASRRLWSRGEHGLAVRTLVGAGLGVDADAVAAYDIGRLDIGEEQQAALRDVLRAHETGGDPAVCEARTFRRAADETARGVRNGSAT